MVCYTIATGDDGVLKLSPHVSVARWFVILLLLNTPPAAAMASVFQLLGGLLYYCYVTGVVSTAAILRFSC